MLVEIPLPQPAKRRATPAAMMILFLMNCSLVVRIGDIQWGVAVSSTRS